jgi:aspartyl-tRNA(Asn)/glutamyl-tRNA(Gln) amidotransferase subunit A
MTFVNQCLEKATSLNSKTNSYISITNALATTQAKESEERWKSGKPLSLLDGIPFSLKDAYTTIGVKTTMASKVLKNFVPQYNSTVYQKLRDAGAILIGKANMDEFAMGSGSVNGYFGPVAQENGLIAGGSSGGSAVSLQSKTCVFSIGSDTGGSVRQPASYCGLVGFKPPYGIVSRHGLIPYVSSMDTVGWFTNNVTDSSILTNILKGSDAKDFSMQRTEIPDVSLEQESLQGVVVGVPIEFYIKELPEDIVKKWKNCITYVKDKGATIRYVSLPHSKYSLIAYYIIASAEASSNLAKYDGIRYGNEIKGEIKTINDVYMKAKEDFGEEVKRRILSGTFSLSIDEYDGMFRKAQQLRASISQDFDDLFDNGIDVILSPTTPYSPVTLQEFIKKSALEKYVEDIFTIHANLSGHAAISVPFEDSFGIQVMSNKVDKIFKVAKNIEK